MSSDEFPTDHPAVVTCGLPYANGDLHIGHLRGYIGADAFNRALQTLGQQSAYVCGSDMHGTPVAVNAEKDGVEPETFALEWHDQYESTFPQFNVDFDNYGHTHDETNTELTQEIVRSLDDAGYIYEKTIQVAYDPDADQYLPDRYVEGTCPYCGEFARGDECDEGCQRHLEPGEIEAPVSSITGNTAEYRERTHKFFRVSEFEEYLTDFLDDLEGTTNAQNQPRQWIEDGLQDWCITRDMDWGIDYPVDDGDTDDLVLYVWVDAPIEYIASTKQYSERVGADEYDWEDVWKRDGEVVHIIGRDIIQHHTIFWPAMLEAADYNAPRGIAATGFITIGGKGLSTSRNRAIWAKEYLDEGFHPDLLRYYLTTTGGLQQDVDFTWEAFQEKVNGELVGTVGNFWYRSLLFAYRNYGGTPSRAELPGTDGEPDIRPSGLSDEVHERIQDAIAEFGDAVNDYSLRGVGRSATELAQFGNEYIQRHEPWKLTDDDPEQAAQVIRDCVQIAKAVAILIEPIAPDTAQGLWDQLNEDGTVSETLLEDALRAPPATFDEPNELFAKIEDDEVDELTAKLDDRIATAAADSEEADTADEHGDEDAGDLEALADDRISFEEFQDLDIRVGRIETAEGIDGADDLARLEVDIGLETRQVVAGIKQLHDLAALPGKKCILLANMEPAELFGVESNGMILAAGEAADLLTTHGDAEVGERVR